MENCFHGTLIAKITAAVAVQPTMKPDPQPHTHTEHDLDYGATLRGFREGTKVFERYTLLRQLGRGGMGVVWLADDERLQVKAALKFLPDELQSDRAAIDDLRRETRRCLTLTHPHIVRIYDLAEGPNAAAIVMEFVDGHTLTDLRLEKPQRCFEVAEITPWLQQIAEALTYAHDVTRIVHRDLKPTNVMLTREGRIKIADFGIASHMQDTLSRTAMTQTISGGGTPCYMSPQQFAGKPPAATDDIYALGATLYELLTGKPPFYTGNIPHQVQHETPPSVAERRVELHVESTEIISPAWEQTLAACLDKDASRRPQRVREVVERLLRAEAKGEEPRVKSREEVTSNPISIPSFKSLYLITLIAVSAVAVGIAVVQVRKTAEALPTPSVAQQSQGLNPFEHPAEPASLLESPTGSGNLSPPTPLPLTTDKPAYRSGDAVRCSLQVPRDGHLRVYSIDAKGDVTQIFPNRFEPDDRVMKGATMHVPGNSAYDLTLELPQGLSRGTETIYAVLSPEEFAPEAAPLAEGEDFRSLGRVAPEQLRTRGLKITPNSQTSTGSVSYEVLP
jgi:serine/threonine protein kinase